jgi:hypothetical protein
MKANHSTAAALLLSLAFAGSASAQATTYQGKITTASSLDPNDPIVSVGQGTYMGQLKPSVQKVIVGCNQKADGNECKLNPQTQRNEREALAVCDRVAVIKAPATTRSGKTFDFVAANGTVSFFNFLMMPVRAIEGNTGNAAGLFGDYSLQTARFKTHLKNPADVMTVDLGGPGHSWTDGDILNSQRTCADAHNRAP